MTPFKWQGLYEDTCNEVAAFTGLDKELIRQPELRYNGTYTLIPSYQTEVDLEKGIQMHQIYIPKEPIHYLSKPLEKFLLQHAFRRCAHYAVMHLVYEQDPEISHKLLRREKKSYSFRASLAKATFRRKKAGLYQKAAEILEKEKVSGKEKDLEKVAHFCSLRQGQKDSFSIGSNLLRDLLALKTALNIPLLATAALAIARPSEIPADSLSSEITARNFLMAIVWASIDIAILKSYIYNNNASLSPRNLLSRNFTPKERSHLLAFPPEKGTLEQRLESLKQAGFMV